MVSSVIYYSDKTEICTEKEILDILESSSKNNPYKNITGILLYTKYNFIQYLEGNYYDIMDLCDIIKKDYRHSNFTFLEIKKDIESRLFPKWAMAHKHLYDDNIEFISELSQEEKFLFNALTSGIICESKKTVDLINLIIREGAIV